MRASDREEQVADLRLAPWIAAAEAAGSRPVRWIVAVAELLPAGAEIASAIEMFQDPQAPQIAVRSVALRVAQRSDARSSSQRGSSIWEVPARGGGGRGGGGRRR